MKAEDPEAMRELDARLSKLYGGLDTGPGFEQRLAARVAMLRRVPVTAEARARLEHEYRRELQEADREARTEATILGVAALGGALAVWRFAPQWSAWIVDFLDRTDPLVVALGALAATAAALWTTLRRIGVEPRSLIGA
jgi:hypothetical protein